MENIPDYRRKRILIITYYWPPSGGSPVLRWLNFTKYLQQMGFEPVIYTPVNPTPQAYDPALKEQVPEGVEVLHRRISEPANLFGLRRSKKIRSTAFISETGRRSFLSKLSVWIRGNFFIPDARMLWIRPSVRFLASYLKKNPCDLIITTGPPHSMHLIGLGLKRLTGIPWITDFRDPWTNIDYYAELMLSRRSDSRHHRLEKAVLDHSDHVITVGPTMTAEFRGLTQTPVSTITNGFDAALTRNIPESKDEEFTILHVGSMPASRNPEVLWEVLGSLIGENKELRETLSIELIGAVDHSVTSAIRNQGLEYALKKTGPVSNKEVLARMKSVSVLLLVVNNTVNAKGILTNKFFEYLSAGKPVLAIGPQDGDLAGILNESGAGKIFGYKEYEGVKGFITELFGRYRKDDLRVDVKNIDKFSRENLTRELVKIIRELIP